MTIERNAARAFTARWAGHGYEKGEAQKFWVDLLEHVLGYKQMELVLFEHHLPGGGFIDVWVRDAGVMVEQKSFGVDLDKPESRQGVMKTPLEQVMDYAEDLPKPQQPRFLITCSFERFRVYDRDLGGRSELMKCPHLEFTLEEFARHPEYLGFIVDPKNSRLEKEKDVSIQAGELIGRLYSAFEACYPDEDGDGKPDIDDATRHALNVLCVRLVFCLYCEDAGLFEKDGFYRYLKEAAPGDIRYRLQRLFRALDTPVDQRDPFDESLRSFPYVNGGLFTDETEIPPFTPEMKALLLDEVSGPVDWSQISPTIFGGIFESTLNPGTRSQGGMHYTSPENIHKVIDPLFLDDLKAELAAIGETPGLTPRQKTNRYKNFNHKLCSLKFLDPASGSGNFLTETYLQLRKLENDALGKLGARSFSFQEEGATIQRVSLSQFYGIEINDFAVKVAEAALWISRLKANDEADMLLSLGDEDFPLTETANITCGNALSLDWNTVLPAGECTYVLGNPPFVGYSNLDPAQQSDRAAIFGKPGGVLDYVACWYRKAADYMAGNRAVQAAFVSTNSICQGQQVTPLWQPLFADGIVINFAHRTFVWSNEAAKQAHVSCVIIGFSYVDAERETKYVWDYSGAGLRDATRKTVEHLNGYLVDLPDMFLGRQRKPLSDVPEMSQGFKPADGGNLLLSLEGRAELLAVEPEAERWIRKFSMGAEFIRGEDRYCLWLEGITPQNLFALPKLRERVEACRAWRLEQVKTGDAYKLADQPHLLRPTKKFRDGTYIAVPAVSSERREYIPMDFVTDGMIPGNKLYFILTDSRYIFGVLMSRIHNAWMRAVAGRLEMRYNYGNTTVYNNLVWPNVTPAQRAEIEATAQGILDARANYPEATLADLYDPGTMPDDLKAAHERNNRAVAAAYGLDPEASETQIVTHLFRLYAQATAKK